MGRTYYSQILSDFDWARIASNGEQGKDEQGDLVESFYLGSVFSIMPSGKYYMPWTSNQTAEDERKDSAYFAALEKAARKFGGWIQSGEGDPTDLYFVKLAEILEGDFQEVSDI